MEGRKENFSELHFIRASACFMVIILHSAANYFYELGPRWMASNIIDSLVRPCVPLFFMISGALLLRRGAIEGFFCFLKNRYCRIICPLVFWSSLACFSYVYFKNESPVYFILRLFATTGFYHLWYLYALVGLYALLPIIGKWYVNSSKAEILFFLGIWFCVCSGSTMTELINKITGKNVDILNLYNVREFASYMGFMVLGALLFEERNNYINKCPRAEIFLLLFAVVGLLTAAVTYAVSMKLSEPCGIFYSYRAPLVITASFLYFIYALRIKFDSNSILLRCVSVISQYSLGIYCVHAFVLYAATKSILPRIQGVLTNFWKTSLAILAMSISVLLISLAISMLFKRIPLLKKVV